MLLPEAKRKKVIGVEEIEDVISKMARIPPKTVSKNDIESLRDLEMNLGHVVFGQNEAIKALSAAIKMARAGLRDPEKPIGCYLFSGPTGVGKTEVARQLSKILGVELLVVTIAEAAYRVLATCVERAHLTFEGVAAAPFVSALAALEEDEMDLGAVCIDMGGGSTSAAIFSGGSLLHVETVPVGGQHVTSDIARGLSTSWAGAERIKTLHGSAIASANEDKEMIEAPPRGDDPGAGPVIAPRSLLKGIIAPRVEETMELLRDRLKASGASVELGAGLILTGGASQLAGVREVALRVFDRPVRLGRPRRVPHLADAASGPAFCAAAGVLQRAAYGPKEAVPARALVNLGVRRESLDARTNPMIRAAVWLRDNL
jgi:cell division protein FtsA